MDPVFHLLMQGQADWNGSSPIRNPDGLFPERDARTPDPLGILFVRALDAISDRIAVRRYVARHAPGTEAIGRGCEAISDIKAG